MILRYFPSVYNIFKKPSVITPHLARNMSLIPRFAAGEFAPLFRLLDDYDSHRSSQGSFSSIRSFAPKFDVQEVKDAYHLDGELPGIDQKDIQIEFTNPYTLVIKGRTEREYTSGPPPEAAEDIQKAAAPKEPSPKKLPQKIRTSLPRPKPLWRKPSLRKPPNTGSPSAALANSTGLSPSQHAWTRMPSRLV
jgi:hypothetical protein